MAELSAGERARLKNSDFALPDRRYPIHDITHGRDALARVAAFGTPSEKLAVRRAVHRRYPSISSEPTK
jgi:hypothetical protein